jgi:uncharacterized protein (DUF4415 family)
MKDDMPEMDFSKGKRGPVISEPGKERITIRLDAAVLAWFRKQVAGGGNYQTLINDALQAHINNEHGTLERTLRKVIREELRAAQ